jgi:hypothetical protein
MIECRSEPLLGSLGRIPPRTPGRSDAQVPCEASLGEAQYASFPHLYFYAEPEGTDPIFGLLDIEIAIQLRRSGEVWLEVYCVGDGFQSGHGSGRENPLVIEVLNDARTLVTVDWPYPEVMCGHFDPMTFAKKTPMSAEDFSVADRIRLPAVHAAAGSCRDATPTVGGSVPHGH